MTAILIEMVEVCTLYFMIIFQPIMMGMAEDTADLGRNTTRAKTVQESAGNW